MPKLEVERIESCECGWYGVKDLLVPETYQHERLITCPKCNAVVYVELTKKEFNKRWLRVVKNGDKEDIANFCRKFRTVG